MKESAAQRRISQDYAADRPALSDLAQTELLRVAFDHLGFALLGNIAACITLTIGIWRGVPLPLLMSWLAAMLVFNTVRWLAGRRLPKGVMGDAVRRKWDRDFLLAAFTSGVLWGIAGWIFFVPGDSGHNFFLALHLVSIAAVAVTTLSYHRIAYPAFFIPAIAPMALLLMLEPGTQEKAAGFVLPVYFLFVFLLSRHIYRATKASVVGRIKEQHLANHDHLTGIANRRRFEEALDREWRRARRSGSSLALILLDIDDFKRFNDTYGHAVGDEVLQAVAAMIARRVRRGGDLAARIGGEELAVLLPNSDAEGARAVAEELCLGARLLHAPTDKAYPPPTLSAGVSACMPGDGAEVDRLLDAVDAALYRAKARGKDRVEVILPEGSLASSRDLPRTASG